MEEIDGDLPSPAYSVANIGGWNGLYIFATSDGRMFTCGSVPDHQSDECDCRACRD